MKTSISYSLLAAAMVCGFAHGQTTAYTTPVGYTTQPIPAGPNKFTYLALTVNQPVVSAGVLDAVTAAPNTVTDTGVDFNSLLTVGATYILELNDGTIQEITSWTALGVLNTPENLTSKVTAGVTTYKLRRASTVSDVFGATNSAGLTPDDDFNVVTNNDVIFILDNAGNPTQVVFNPEGEVPAGWYTAAGDPAGNLPIVYADGFYIRRAAGSLINLVTSGEVKTKLTSGVLLSNFNYLSSVAPVGLTFGTSGLQNFITQATNGDPFSAPYVDNVLIPTPTGFLTVYYSDGTGEAAAGWYTAADDDATNIVLEGSFLIRNRGAAKPYKINVPASFSGF